MDWVREEWLHCWQRRWEGANGDKEEEEEEREMSQVIVGKGGGIEEKEGKLGAVLALNKTTYYSRCSKAI